jgi:S-phase kinase-associated protein 1
MDSTQVTLQSSDAKSFQVDVKVATMSQTIKGLIEDAGTVHAIPLPNISGKALEKIVEYAKHHADLKSLETKNEDETEDVSKRTDDISEWDQNFCKVDQEFLFELLLAANYLDIKGLLDLVCKSVANMIKGKTPAEIRETFNIKREFTKEEIDEVKKENMWSEER